MNTSIYNLTSSTIRDNGTISTNAPKILVFVYSNSCGYCKQARPALEEFAKKFKGNIDVVQIGGDTKDGRETLKKIITPNRINFEGFPAYFIFNNGRFVSDRIKDRSVTGLIDFSFNN